MATNDADSADDRLNEIIAEYLRGVDDYRSGFKKDLPDREALLARHRDLAAELQAFFANCDQMDDQRGKLCGEDASAGADLPRPSPDRVHYFGDYEVGDELGRGGMGVVYEARQISLNRPVALKFIKAGLLADDDDLRRFQNEAEALASLDHPGIVPIYEIGEHEGRHYFSMKFVSGGSLVPLIERFKDNTKDVAALVAKVAESVAHAHMLGILHRDLKPANILLDAEGNPHVTDFSLAKRLQADVESTASGAIVGTLAYMAPEQANGRRGSLTTATDVYGLGATLYALLTGRAPFGGRSEVETLDAVRNTPPDSPRKLNAQVPRDLETICLKCLEKDRRRRYPTAQALADDLHAWLEGRPIAARRVGVAERAWLWCRRKPAMAAAMFTAAVTVIIAFVAITLSRNDLRRQRDIARSRELAATAISELQVDPERSLRLAIEAARIARTGQAEDALRTSLTHSYIRSLLRSGVANPTDGKISPDGRKVVLADENGVAELWDVSGQRLVATLQGHSDRIIEMSFDPDGTKLITTSRDGTTRVWEADFGTLLVSFGDHSNPVRHSSFSPDGRFAVGVQGSEVRAWALTERAMWKLDKDGVFIGPNFVFRPDSELLIVADAQQVRGALANVHIVDAKTGGTLPGRTDSIDRIIPTAFSPDGKLMISGDMAHSHKIYRNGWPDIVHSNVLVREVGTGQTVVVLTGHAAVVTCAAFSPDSTLVATGCQKSPSYDKTVRVWEARTGKTMATLVGHTDGVTHVLFSSDGRFILTTGEDKTVRVWEAQTGSEVAVLRGHENRLFSVAFGSDGRSVVGTGSDGTIRVWDAGLGMHDFELRAHAEVLGTAFLAEGGAVITIGEDNTVRKWETSSGEEIRVINVSKEFIDFVKFYLGKKNFGNWVWSLASGKDNVWLGGHATNLAALALSPDGRMLVAVDADTFHSYKTGVDWTAMLVDVESGRVRALLPGHEGRIQVAAFSPDSTAVLTGGSPSTTQLWDATTGELRVELKLREFFAHGVHGASFSPDGRRVATIAHDDSVRMWDVSTGKLKAEMTLPGGSMSRVEYSHDGTLIAAGNVAGYVRVWEANTSRLVMQPSEYEPGATVTSVEFSPDDRFLLTAGGHGPYGSTTKVWVWDVRTGQLVTVLRGLAPVTKASFSPDGKSVLTLNKDGIVHIYSVAECGPIDDLVDLAQKRLTTGSAPR